MALQLHHEYGRNAGLGGRKSSDVSYVRATKEIAEEGGGRAESRNGGRRVPLLKRFVGGVFEGFGDATRGGSGRAWTPEFRRRRDVYYDRRLSSFRDGTGKTRVQCTN